MSIAYASNSCVFHGQKNAALSERLVRLVGSEVVKSREEGIIRAVLSE